MKIKNIISELEKTAPVFLQEDYDNSGLLTGDAEWVCSGILVTLDTTEEVIAEAADKKCNLVISHHPVIFSGLKSITGKNYVERAVIRAIRHDIAIYAIHTNLDNILNGVNGRIAEMIGLHHTQILSEKSSLLKKLYTFVPLEKADEVRQAIFEAGAGQIGNYSECSFNVSGFGTFKGNQGADPYKGKPGLLHKEDELKIEVIFPSWLQSKVVQGLISAHPYEEVAYDIINLDNKHQLTGSGVIGELEKPSGELDFLKKLKKTFNTGVIKHTPLRDRPISKVAVCGGAGSFLIFKALSMQADIFLTADIRYHEFFNADGRMILADIGHYESEQFTINLLQEILEQKFPNFAVLKTGVNTNPVRYHS